MRVLFLLLSVAALGVYLLGRDLTTAGRPGWPRGRAASHPGQSAYATGVPVKTTMALLLLALLAASVPRWGWAGARRPGHSHLAAGASSRPVAVAAAPRRRAAPGCALWARSSTAALSLTVMAAYFAAVGRPGGFRDGFVLIHLRYTYQPPLVDDLEAALGSAS